MRHLLILMLIGLLTLASVPFAAQAHGMQAGASQEAADHMAAASQMHAHSDCADCDGDPGTGVPCPHGTLCVVFAAPPVLSIAPRLVRLNLAFPHDTAPRPALVEAAADVPPPRFALSLS